MPSTITNSHFSENIVIEYKGKEGWHDVESALNKINTGIVGHELLVELKDLCVNDKNIKIVVSEGHTFALPRLTASQIKRFGTPADEFDKFHNEVAEKICEPHLDGMNGAGTSVTIGWNPMHTAGITQDGRPYMKTDKTGSFISLAHELIHGHHILTGDYLGGSNPDEFDIYSRHASEEFRTVGIREFYNERFSENLIRLENNFPFRSYYSQLEEEEYDDE